MKEISLWCKKCIFKKLKKLNKHKFAKALCDNKSRQCWSEVKKIRNKNTLSSQCTCIDNISGDENIAAPNDPTYKRWSCHSGLKLLCKLCRTSPPPAMGARFTVFLGMPAMRTRWMAGAAAHKSG